MSDSDKCPKCGAEFAYTEAPGWTNWKCLSCRNRHGEFSTSPECYLRQLAQRDERIAKLESDILLYKGRLEYLARTVVFDGPRMDLGGGLSSETLQTSSLEAVLAERAEAKAHIAAIKPLVRAAWAVVEWWAETDGDDFVAFAAPPEAGVMVKAARALPAEERAWWEEA